MDNTTQCLSETQIIENGGSVIKNDDGTLSVYVLNNVNVLAPFILNKNCCEALNPSIYYFDIINQKCKWSNLSSSTQNCTIPEVFKIVLNPNGNDGTLFYVEENDNCNLKIEFDYLFKITCENLMSTTNGVNMASVFESLDISIALDVVTTANTLQTVFEYNFFPAIGSGNLYRYLSANTNTGFYVCGDPTGSEISFSNCTPLYLDINNNDNNVFNCGEFIPYLIYELFIESGLNPPMNINTAFTNNLRTDVFSSKWLTFSIEIDDPQILSLIANKKIKLSIKINNSISDFCILLDNIILDKKCSHLEGNKIFLSQSPGFELNKIRDNKKSWVNNKSFNRNFLISNNIGNNNIRETKYSVNDDRLVINSKEIDLDISLASGIETDVWCYISDNPCILTGITCGTKSFMNGDCFIFMDNEFYDFQDANIISGDEIPFNVLLTQPLSSITTVEEFELYITSELIDVKDRQTLSGYPTLRALYDRYMNSTLYCGTNSSKFNYLTMDKFANLVGNYWVDIVEQVVPATTIWGSVKVYSNTIFDQQKFKYKKYTSLFNGNPYSGITIPSPINGTTGFCSSVEVETSVINITGVTSSSIIKYDKICLAQMNTNSEFIGFVNIIGDNTNNENVINEN